MLCEGLLPIRVAEQHPLLISLRPWPMGRSLLCGRLSRRTSDGSFGDEGRMRRLAIFAVRVRTMRGAWFRGRARLAAAYC